MTTIRDVAKAAGVSTATVSAVVNDSAYVSPELRTRVQAAIEELNYAPSMVARNLKRGKSQLIAISVADLSNPFYSHIVCLAEAAAAAWGYSLVVFNSDEKTEAEKRILSRIRMLSCDGMLLVPVGETAQHLQRDVTGRTIPTVLFGRVVDDRRADTVTIDNESAGRQATNYLLDLGHRRIGSITGPMHLTTGRGRYDGMMQALQARGVAPAPHHIRPGEFREGTAYAVAREMLEQPDRPTALYIANGVMALGVMRALADLGLKCPEDVSIASTDTIPGISGLRPRFTRTEHPIADMINESFRMLVGRINKSAPQPPRNVVFQPTLVVGESCAPLVGATGAASSHASAD
jgi:LacI family transcriptional regulator